MVFWGYITEKVEKFHTDAKKRTNQTQERKIRHTNKQQNLQKSSAKFDNKIIRLARNVRIIRIVRIDVDTPVQLMVDIVYPTLSLVTGRSKLQVLSFMCRCTGKLLFHG